MPRKTNQDQDAAVSVYEASPGRAPAGARDVADDLLPPEHRFSDEERGRPPLSWLSQETASGPGIRGRHRQEQHLGSENFNPPQETSKPPRADGAALTAPIAVVVEGDESVREFAAAILEKTDLDVITCESAADALAVMRKRGSEVALLFMEMQLSGEIDGATLAREVERDWPDVRIVVTSRSSAAKAVPDHAVYMQKPWQPLDVLVEAERSLRRKSA